MALALFEEVAGAFGAVEQVSCVWSLSIKEINISKMKAFRASFNIAQEQVQS